MTPRVRAWLAALPDATTAVAFGLAWIVPGTVGLPFVRTMFVTFLLEFIAVHAGGMLAGANDTANPRAAGRRRLARPVAVVSIALSYVAFAAAFCFIFGTWWTFVAFALVMLAKVVPVVTARPGAEVQGMQTWAASVLWYLVAVFATLFLPIPPLGLDEVKAALDLPGSGEWIDAPQKPLAAGVLYFTLMAWTRGAIAKQ